MMIVPQPVAVVRPRQFKVRSHQQSCAGNRFSLTGKCVIIQILALRAVLPPVCVVRRFPLETEDQT